jgi:hypothetical protein
MEFDNSGDVSTVAHDEATIDKYINNQKENHSIDKLGTLQK